MEDVEFQVPVQHLRVHWRHLAWYVAEVLVT